MTRIDDTMSTAQLTGHRAADPPTVCALILHELEHYGPCTIETLTSTLPHCSWNQLFMAIDTLSREGALLLRPQARSQYLVSLAAPRRDTYRPLSPAGTTEAMGLINGNLPRDMKEAEA